MRIWNTVKTATVGLTALALSALPQQAQGQFNLEIPKNQPQIIQQDTTEANQQEIQLQFADSTRPLINSPYTLEVQEQLREYISNNNHEILRMLSDSTTQASPANKSTYPTMSKPFGHGNNIGKLEATINNDQAIYARMPTHQGEDLHRTHDGVSLQASVLLDAHGELVIPQNGDTLDIYTPHSVEITGAKKVSFTDGNRYTILVDDVSHHWIKRVNENGTIEQSNPLFVIGAETNQRELQRLTEDNEQYASSIKTKDLTIRDLNKQLSNQGPADTTSAPDTTNQDSPADTTIQNAIKPYSLSLRLNGSNTPLNGSIVEETAHNTTTTPYEHTGRSLGAELKASYKNLGAFVQAQYFTGEEFVDFENIANKPDNGIELPSVTSDVEELELHAQATYNVLAGLHLGLQGGRIERDITPQGPRFGTAQETTYRGVVLGLQNENNLLSAGPVDAEHLRSHKSSSGRDLDFTGSGYTLRARTNIPLSDRLSAGLNIDATTFTFDGEEYDFRERLGQAQATLKYAVSDKVSFTAGLEGEYRKRVADTQDFERSGLGLTIGVQGRF